MKDGAYFEEKKYQKFSLNAFKEDLRYILNGYIEITDNLIERTNVLLEKE